MSEKTKLKIEVTYIYEIEVDEEDSCVKDYDSRDEMLNHLVDYQFSTTLPVRKSGVEVKDVEVESWKVTN
jgi:hypothetical protein